MTIAVANYNPSLGSTVLRNTPIAFDVTGIPTGTDVILTTYYSDATAGLEEVVYKNGVFSPYFSLNSRFTTTDANDLHFFNVLRDGGWPSTILRFEAVQVPVTSGDIDPTVTPQSVGDSNIAGVAATSAAIDHVHNHGTHAVSNHHALASGSTNGFMSPAQAVSLAALVAGAATTVTPSQLSGAGTTAALATALALGTSQKPVKITPGITIALDTALDLAVPIYADLAGVIIQDARGAQSTANADSKTNFLIRMKAAFAPGSTSTTASAVMKAGLLTSTFASIPSDWAVGSWIRVSGVLPAMANDSANVVRTEILQIASISGTTVTWVTAPLQWHNTDTVAQQITPIIRPVILGNPTIDGNKQNTACLLVLDGVYEPKIQITGKSASRTIVQNLGGTLGMQLDLYNAGNCNSGLMEEGHHTVLRYRADAFAVPYYADGSSTRQGVTRACVGVRSQAVGLATTSDSVFENHAGAINIRGCLGCDIRGRALNMNLALATYPSNEINTSPLSGSTFPCLGAAITLGSTAHLGPSANGTDLADDGLWSPRITMYAENCRCPSSLGDQAPFMFIDVNDLQADVEVVNFGYSAISGPAYQFGVILYDMNQMRGSIKTKGCYAGLRTIGSGLSATYLDLLTIDTTDGEVANEATAIWLGHGPDVGNFQLRISKLVLRGADTLTVRTDANFTNDINAGLTIDNMHVGSYHWQNVELCYETQTVPLGAIREIYNDASNSNRRSLRDPTTLNEDNLAVACYFGSDTALSGRYYLVSRVGGSSAVLVASGSVIVQGTPVYASTSDHKAHTSGSLGLLGHCRGGVGTLGSDTVVQAVGAKGNIYPRIDNPSAAMIVGGACTTLGLQGPSGVSVTATSGQVTAAGSQVVLGSGGVFFSDQGFSNVWAQTNSAAAWQLNLGGQGTSMLLGGGTAPGNAVGGPVAVAGQTGGAVSSGSNKVGGGAIIQGAPPGSGGTAGTGTHGAIELSMGGAQDGVQVVEPVNGTIVTVLGGTLSAPITSTQWPNAVNGEVAIGDSAAALNPVGGMATGSHPTATARINATNGALRAQDIFGSCADLSPTINSTIALTTTTGQIVFRDFVPRIVTSSIATAQPIYKLTASKLANGATNAIIDATYDVVIGSASITSMYRATVNVLWLWNGTAWVAANLPSGGASVVLSRVLDAGSYSPTFTTSVVSGVLTLSVSSSVGGSPVITVLATGVAIS